MVKGNVIKDISKFPKAKQIETAKLLLFFHEARNKNLNFSKKEVEPVMIGNKIFLTNDRQQLACFNKDIIDTWVFCPSCCREGLSTVLNFEKGLCSECRGVK